MAPVPVVCSKSLGAKISGFGDGKLVSAGFVANAASRAGCDSGGVMSVMSACNQILWTQNNVPLHRPLIPIL